MDEVANSLGISKKTIYKYFPSKNNLINEVMQDTIQEAVMIISTILRNEPISYLDRLKQLLMFLGDFATKIGAAPIQDLQKSAPDIWAEFEEIREKYILANFRGFMQDGIKQGIIRSDINQDILMLMLVNSIRTIINPKVLTEMSFAMKEAFDMIIKVILNGILTEKYRI